MRPERRLVRRRQAVSNRRPQSGDRAQRFDQDQPVKKYEQAEQRIMATWSLDCAERVLPLFERVHPEDPRPRRALTVGRNWVRTGDFRMAVIRRASLEAHAAAKEVEHRPAACAAAHAAGQAVATAHVAQHAYGGAYYALRAVAADADCVLSRRVNRVANVPDKRLKAVIAIVQDKRQRRDADIAAAVGNHHHVRIA